MGIGSYKQCRINFNSDDPNEMVAYEHFKSLGRKATEYIVKLILADLSGDVETFEAHDNIALQEVINRLEKIESRLSVLEGDSDSVELQAVLEPQKEEGNIKAVSDPLSSTPEHENNEGPAIPPDLAARLGGF